MNTTPNSSPLDSKKGITRRTIVQGAAWSVPVVAAAVATPLAAASAAICPALAPASAWTWQVPATGTLRTQVNGQASARTGANGGELYVSHEAQPGTGAMTITASTTLAVVAGTTYDLSFFFGSNYGGLNTAVSTRSAVSLTVDGANLFWGSTRPIAGNTTIPNNTAASGYTNYGSTTASFSADATETIVVTYTFVSTATSATQPNGDDIAITVPVITCR